MDLIYIKMIIKKDYKVMSINLHRDEVYLLIEKPKLPKGIQEEIKNLKT